MSPSPCRTEEGSDHRDAIATENCIRRSASFACVALRNDATNRCAAPIAHCQQKPPLGRRKLKMRRLTPIETLQELRQLLFDLPGDTAVEIEAEIAIVATTALELYYSPWQGPVALVINYDPNGACISLVRVERP